VAKELKEVSRGSVESLVGFLSKYEGMLGPTNHHIVEVPGFLSHDQLGKVEGFSSNKQETLWILAGEVQYREPAG
jgi:hypothetical protein